VHPECACQPPPEIGLPRAVIARFPGQQPVGPEHQRLVEASGQALCETKTRQLPRRRREIATERTGDGPSLVLHEVIEDAPGQRAALIARIEPLIRQQALVERGQPAARQRRVEQGRNAVPPRQTEGDPLAHGLAGNDEGLALEHAQRLAGQFAHGAIEQGFEPIAGVQVQHGVTSADAGEAAEPNAGRRIPCSGGVGV